MFGSTTFGGYRAVALHTDTHPAFLAASPENQPDAE
jgi:hypothetical protein